MITGIQKQLYQKERELGGGRLAAGIRMLRGRFCGKKRDAREGKGEERTCAAVELVIPGNINLEDSFAPPSL